jgi:CO/xanthine dehydrogenase FAD-binding subunit
MPLFYRRLPRFEYLAPRTIDEALGLLTDHKGEARVIAGGTDLVPQLKSREVAAPRYVVDLKAIPGLDTITYDASSGLKIGALATISSIEGSDLVGRHFPILAQAASRMASPQVRNMGTFAGNLCNAVPSADSAPPLLALGAAVLIASPQGSRTIPLNGFFTGPRRTVLKEDEIVTEIEVPPAPAASIGVYLKLSPRHSMDLAIVGVAVVASMRDGVCTHASIGLGAVAPTPVRAPVAESILAGKYIDADIVDEAARNVITQCSPIDDHRASQEYRCDMVYVMTRRALTQVLLGEVKAQ